MNAKTVKIEFTEEQLVEVERFRLFLRIVGLQARTIDETQPPLPTLFTLLRAASPGTDWLAWLGFVPPKQRVEDDHPHEEEEDPYAPGCNMGDDL